MAHQVEGGTGYSAPKELDGPLIMGERPTEGVCHSHVHVDEQGFLVKCYHTCKSFVKMPSFWAAQTLLFPLEHFLWTKVPGFSHLAEMLGLITH